MGSNKNNNRPPHKTTQARKEWNVKFKLLNDKHFDPRYAISLAPELSKTSQKKNIR